MARHLARTVFGVFDASQVASAALRVVSVSVWFAPLLPEELELLLLELLLPEELELLLLELLEELELELLELLEEVALLLPLALLEELELELELLLEALLLPLLGAIGGATGSLGGGLDAYTLEKFRSRRVPPWRSISAALARM